MSRSLATTLALLAITPALHAAPTFTRELPPETILSLTGNADTDPRGLAVTADGSTWYLFEDDTSDAILRKSGASLTVFASKAQIESALGIVGVTLTDMTVDPATGILYAVVRPGSAATLERIIRVPSAGTVQNVVSTLHSDGIDSIDVDTLNSRLVFTRIAFNGAVASNVGVWTVPLAATNAVPTQLANEVALAAALTPAGSLFEPSDLVVQSDGDIILANANGTDDANQDGDLVRLTGAGAASAFADRVTLLTVMGNAAGDIGDTYLERDSTDRILLWHNGSTSPGECLLLGTANGATWLLLANETQMLSASAFLGATDVGADANGIAATADGRLGIAHVATGSEGIVVAAQLAPTGVAEWNLFD